MYWKSDRSGFAVVRQVYLGMVALAVCQRLLGQPCDVAVLQSFHSPAPTEHAEFGTSVAGLGATAIIGASHNDSGAMNSGAVFLFDTRTGQLEQTLVNPDPNTSDNFGRFVTAIGGNVVVGAYADDIGAIVNAGSAYSFDSETGQVTMFHSPTPTFVGLFGFSLAGFGENVLVGAHQEHAAYLFDNAANLLMSFFSPSPGDNFGCSVAALGTKVVIGARNADMGAQNTGAVFVFDGLSGQPLYTLMNPTPVREERFGFSVAASNNVIAVGAPGNGTSFQFPGEAYLYNGDTGALLRTLMNPKSADCEPDGWLCGFGFAVAIAGDSVLIGAPFDSTAAERAGAAYLFDAKSGTLVAIYSSPDPTADGHFGYSVALVDDGVLVGAPRDNLNAGAAYLFPPTCLADCAVPCDGYVSVVDLLEVISQWGTVDTCDFDGDGVVAVPDLLTLLAAWGPCQ